MSFGSKVIASSAPPSTILIRLIVGAVFLSEGIQKFLFPNDLGVGRFSKIGIPAPQVIAPFVGVIEIVCGNTNYSWPANQSRRCCFDYRHLGSHLSRPSFPSSGIMDSGDFLSANCPPTVSGAWPTKRALIMRCYLALFFC